jgi:hypothetical protein
MKINGWKRNSKDLKLLRRTNHIFQIKKLVKEKWWLTPVILQEAKIRMTVVQSQPRETVHETLSQKNPSQK